MRVLNFGSLNLDLVYQMDHLIRGGETFAAGRLDKFPGGKGLNQSVALARAGAQVYHAGNIGTDGELLTSTLADAGVHTEFLRVLDMPSGHAVIQVDRSGENANRGSDQVRTTTALMRSDAAARHIKSTVFCRKRWISFFQNPWTLPRTQCIPDALLAIEAIQSAVTIAAAGSAI